MDDTDNSQKGPDLRLPLNDQGSQLPKIDVKLDSPDGIRLSREVNQDAPGAAPGGITEEKADRKQFIPREDGFDMVLVAVNFERTMDEPDALLMDPYLVAYQELERFLSLMGSIFGFVGSDVRDKLEILNKHRHSEKEGRHYVTLKSMMNYEKSSPALLEPTRTTASHPLPSASRTLLRLHRALEFIMLLMEGLIHVPDDEGVAHLAQDCYSKSLSKYHGWIIRKGAHVAMYTLPTKFRLMEKISKHPYDEVEAFARRMVDSMKPVYDRTQGLYSQFDLHELP